MAYENEPSELGLTPAELKKAKKLFPGLFKRPGRLIPDKGVTKHLKALP